VNLDVGPLRLLRLPEVLARVGLRRSAVYELVSRGAFPQPCRLGQRCVAWSEHEVDAWISKRLDERPR
jgi:prophage regulatory protein